MSDNYEKGAEARRNIIVSHGGKHGASQTFLRGAPIPPETARHIPKDNGLGLIAPADLTGQNVPTPPPAPTALTASGQPAATTPPVPSATAGEPKPGTPAATGQAAVPGTAKPPIPTNVRELFALTKDELLALANDLGVPTEGEQTVKTLREALKTAMEL